MSTGLPSDEVAEDYKGSLDDLVTNDRYQISNLTLIAKENIEHAEAISRVLQNHIQRTSPSKKLPALYVLDSIVKNVGSPFTIYFGRQLYQTFMHAYSQVDPTVRRKLEEMLKTWREPSPGSLSTAPVFPLASTQAIVDNLNKLRASTATPVSRYTHQVPSTSRVASTQPYRNTPTPPQIPTQPIQPLPQIFPVQYGQQYAQQLPYDQVFHNQPISSIQPTQHVSTPTPSFPGLQNQRPASTVDVQKLHADIDDLTTDAKIECATHPLDANAQKKLATLQTLKEILESGAASESDLIDIKSSIMQEMAKKITLKQPDPPSITLPIHTPYQPPQPQPSVHQLPSFLNSTNLAELLRATANPSQNNQGPPTYISPQPVINTPPMINSTPIPPAGELPLLAQLRASGLLSAAPTPPQILTPPTAYSAFPNNIIVEVTLTSASIKIPRPQMVTTFLNSRPNQCSTCGRRFTSDDIGKDKKARHLDWHFKTKARMLEAEKRGQNRSWYVDEREWIGSKEYDDDNQPLEKDGTNSNGVSSTKKPQELFVRAPVDPVLRNLPCPIDQEPFKSVWSEEHQEFIWTDCIQVGQRYYHASCYAEVTKNRDRQTGKNTPLGRTATPDSVTRKRKAEQDDANGIKSKIKLEV